jgi:Mn-dependent DtxR family transcriptional regulator
MEEAQQRAIEMEHHEMEVIAKRRCTILDIVTLLEKGIKIPDLERFMWTQTKQNYDKHVKWMEN